MVTGVKSSARDGDVDDGGQVAVGAIEVADRDAEVVGELALEARRGFPLGRPPQARSDAHRRAAIEAALPGTDLTRLWNQVAVGVDPGPHLGVLAQRVELVDQLRALTLRELADAALERPCGRSRPRRRPARGAERRYSR